MRHIAETAARPPWAEYRRLRRLYWFAWVGYVPIVGLIGVALWRAFGSRAAFPITVVALAWMAFGGFMNVSIARYRCPRCGNRFHVGKTTNFYSRQCLHCGLPRWAEPLQAAGAA